LSAALEHMDVEYDPEADALYVRFMTGSIANTLEVTPSVMVDRDGAGHILGVEVLNPREHLEAARRWLRGQGIELPGVVIPPA
jgi:uncharacterized protein YuzE